MFDILTAYFLELLCLGGISFALCYILASTAQVWPRLAGRVGDVSAVQAAHTAATPRVAGLAVFGAFAVGTAFAPIAFSERFTIFVGATSVLFAVGLLEDLGVPIAPKMRLAAAAVSSLLVIFFLDIWLDRAGLSWLDPYVAYWPIGGALTVFITVGLANAFNLIDGVNGLAAVVGIACTIALAFVAERAGYTAMVKFNLMFAFTLLGFALLNFPFGKIFLGDAGAYTIGFVVSWFGIFMLVRYPEISPWAVLLTVFWPVADTVLAIYRRAMRRSLAFLPDRLHVHQLVMRGLEIVVLGRGRRKLANPLTTVVLTPFVIAPPLTGIWLWDDNGAAGLAILVYGVGFWSFYLFGFAVVRRFRLSRSQPISVENSK